MALGLEIQREHMSLVKIPFVLHIVVACLALAWLAFYPLSCFLHWHQAGSIRAGAGRIWKSFNGPPETEKRIAAITRMKHFEMWTLILRFYVVVMAPFMLLGTSAAAYWGVFPKELVYTVFYYCTLFLTSVGFFFFAVPRTWTPLSSDIFYYVLCIVFGFLPALAETTESYHFMVTVARVIHLGLAAAGPSFQQFIPYNVLFLVWELWIICTASGLQPSLAENIAAACFAFFYTIGVRIGAYIVVREMAKALLKAGHTESIVRALLNVMCDVLVTLNEDLMLREDSPRLCALLLGTPSVTGRSGQRFSSLMAPEEALRFEDFVQSAPYAEGEEAPARQLALDLRDSTGHEVSVHVYHYCLKDPVEGRLTHFLGIVEDTQLERGPLTTPTSSGRAVPDSATAMKVEPKASDSDGDVSEEGSSVGAGITSWSSDGPATVLLRTWLHWEIVEESEQSRALFGLTQDAANPVELVNRISKPHMFLRWLEFAHVMATLNYPNGKKTFEDAVLRCPGTSQEYSTNISMECESQPDPVPEEEGHFALEFEAKSRYVDLRLTLSPPEKKVKKRRRRQVEEPTAPEAQDAADLTVATSSGPPLSL